MYDNLRSVEMPRTLTDRQSLHTSMTRELQRDEIGKRISNRIWRTEQVSLTLVEINESYYHSQDGISDYNHPT